MSANELRMSKDVDPSWLEFDSNTLDCTQQSINEVIHSVSWSRLKLFSPNLWKLLQSRPEKSEAFVKALPSNG